jgi:hypothetical protein
MEGVVRPEREGVHALSILVNAPGMEKMVRDHHFLVEGPEESDEVGGRFEILAEETTQKVQALDSPLRNAVFRVKLRYRIHPKGRKALWMQREFVTFPDGEEVKYAERKGWTREWKDHEEQLERRWEAGCSGGFHRPGVYKVRVVLEGEGFPTWERSYEFRVIQKK